jgi:hypothetical protein
MDFQRLSQLFPTCTILAMELTIIERASLLSPRPRNSASMIRSAAVGAAVVRRDGPAVGVEGEGKES